MSSFRTPLRVRSNHCPNTHTSLCASPQLSPRRIFPNPELFIRRKSVERSHGRTRPLQAADFRKGKILSQGRFGRVYAVKHVGTGMVFALKVISKATVRRESMQEQVRREIICQSRINSSHVIGLIAFFDDKDNVYLLQELGVQQNLYMQLKVSRVQALGLRQVKMLLRMLLEGLADIHSAGIVHRDLKPENIVFTLGSAKICDFGYSAWNTRQVSGFCGTVDYIAPEVAAGSLYNEKADIWSAGVLLFQLLTGNLPFSGVDDQQTLQNIVLADPTALASLEKQVGTQTWQFLGLLLQRSPGARPSARQLLSHQFMSEQQ